ncbi:unnamed protein product [Auanema sp. JU1783]|nr:unnamed protein product [Auanema sp. JU1783]
MPSTRNDAADQLWDDIETELNIETIKATAALNKSNPADKLINVSSSNELEDQSSNPSCSMSEENNSHSGDVFSPTKRLENATHLVLLQKETFGMVVRNRVVECEDVRLPRGTIMKPVSRAQDFAALLGRMKPYCIALVDILDSSTFAIIRESDIMRINDDQALILMAMSAEKRFQLHNDFEHFVFVEGLKKGDLVMVNAEQNVSEDSFQGRIIEIVEIEHRYGLWFYVEPYGMNEHEYSSPRQAYYNGSQLSKPAWNSIATYGYKPTKPPTEVRNVPIRRVEHRVETVFDADNSYHRHRVNGDGNEFEKDLTTWDGELRSINDPMREWRNSGEHREKRHSTTRRSNNIPNNRPSSSQPSRSQSAHVVAVYDRTFSVDDITKTNGARVGDRCRWIDGDKSHLGYIRFIGHLKGHSNLYAGIEFDDAIGRGTGVFQGEIVFQTPENRAGFVLLCSLVILSRPRSQDGNHTFNMRHKQASAESLSDPLPPLPPPVPPAPPMRPEDYMIDSFSADSYVEVCYRGACRSGVVRWVGEALSEDNDHLQKSAIVELDEDIPAGWRIAPSSSSKVYQRAVIVPTSTLRRDRRVQSSSEVDMPIKIKTDFGSIDSGIETSRCEPSKIVDDLLGRMKGIQGHRNSCYIDATLYAMFVQTTAFDFLLERPTQRGDVPQYFEFVRVLSSEIVYPLRKFHYVRADHIMRLRQLLSEILPHIKGLTNEEKDPEEVLGEVFRTILKAKPFLEIINLKDNKIDRTYLCPLIVEDWQGGVATTQHLLERSMKGAGVKFVFPPKLLILQLPRYGQQKVFDKILPLERIDITGLVHNAVQQCFSCNKPAEGMCPECFLCKRVFLTEVSFCVNCFKKNHLNAGEGDHHMREFYPSARPVKKAHVHKMTLSAVLCIETSHYVAFVRHASTGRWLFFDSMADREGLSEGFNVPKVSECEKMSWWLSSAGWDKLRMADQIGCTNTLFGKGSDMDPLVTRLLSDSYICFYQEESFPQSTSTNLITNVLQKMKM